MPSNKLKLYSYYALDAVLGLGLLYGVYKTFLARDSRGFLQSIFPEQQPFALPESDDFTPVYTIRDLIAKLEKLKLAAIDYHNQIVGGAHIVEPNPLVYLNSYLIIESPEDYYTPKDITIMINLLRELLASNRLPPEEISPGTTIEYVGGSNNEVNRTVGLFTKKELTDSVQNPGASNQIWNEKEGIKVVKNGDGTISIGFLPSTRTIIYIQTISFQLMKQKYPERLAQIENSNQLNLNDSEIQNMYSEVLEDTKYFIREIPEGERQLPSMPSYWRKYSWIPAIYWKPLYGDIQEVTDNTYGYLRLKNANT